MDHKSWNLKIYDQFDQNESENCNTPATLRFECDNPPISEYFKLMDRLKPYYFKKETHKKIFEDNIESLKQYEKAKTKYLNRTGK